MIASKVTFLASYVTQLGVNVMIIGGTETFARLQMSVNLTNLLLLCELFIFIISVHVGQFIMF